MMHRRLLPTLTATAALLAGCAVVGPDYQRPAVSLPASYLNAGDGSATLASEWWTLYGDAELDRLVGKALAANTDIAMAAARVLSLIHI